MHTRVKLCFLPRRLIAPRLLASSPLAAAYIIIFDVANSGQITWLGELEVFCSQSLVPKTDGNRCFRMTTFNAQSELTGVACKWSVCRECLNKIALNT